jgi:hypothetical protein
MSYPLITFKREPAVEPEATRWGAYHNGERFGAVASMPLGYWNQVDGGRGYSTRYEAAYGLLTGSKR